MGRVVYMYLLILFGKGVLFSRLKALRCENEIVVNFDLKFRRSGGLFWWFQPTVYWNCINWRISVTFVESLIWRGIITTIKSTDCGARLVGLAPTLTTSYWTILCLSFLICKVGIRLIFRPLQILYKVA